MQKIQRKLKKKLSRKFRPACRKIRVLDLFAGAGGLSLGFDLVRNAAGEKVFEIIRAVEIDPDACQTLRDYFKKEYQRDNVVLQGDLTKKETRKRIIEECEDGIDIIVGGPPCQSFSTIGPRSGYGVNDDSYDKNSRDGLYKEYLHLVEQLKPSFIIFENVKGITSKKDRHDRRYVDVIAADFMKLGYSFENESKKVNDEYLLLNAADYGVPQMRERVFLIGNRLGIKNPYPLKTHFNPSLKIAPFWTTLRDAIGDLPELKAKYTMTDVRGKEKKKIAELNQKIYSGAEAIPFHKERFDKHLKSISEKGKALLRFLRAGANGTLAYHLCRSQKKDDIKLFSGMLQGETAKNLYERKSLRAKQLRKLVKYTTKLKKGEYTFPDKYRKQHWDKPSTTIFSHLEKDGNRFIHPDSRQARTFTVREAARIQTFPDWYEFRGSRGSKFRQIGNAVPPLLARIIAAAIYSKLRTDLI